MVQSSAQPPSTPQSADTPLICHVLIGPPASGKSTLAEQWHEQHPDTVIVSSDRIRADLYGDETIQGHWPTIETEVLRQIETALRSRQPVMYDATNTRRLWRVDLMQKLRCIEQRLDRQCWWIGWYFKTKLDICLKWNKTRKRQISEEIIKQFHQDLRQLKPIPAEGFTVVHPVPVEKESVDLATMQVKLDGIPSSLQQRARRQRNWECHIYSSLDAFEQLLYLIATLLQFPGAGTLHQTNPGELQKLLPDIPIADIVSPIDEMVALITHTHGALYSAKEAIARNLTWLEQNGLVNTGQYTSAAIELPSVSVLPSVSLHRYADREPFERLIQLIRFVAHHPFTPSANGQTKLHEALGRAMAQHHLHYGTDALRRDISEILKPYKIMANNNMRQGYFLGPAILSQHELLRVFNCLEGPAKCLDDPIAVDAYETFRERLIHLKNREDDITRSYPIRTVVNRTIVDAQYLPDNSLAQPHNAELIESAIAQGQLLDLKRLRGTGRFEHHDDQPFTVLPLQIVFYNIAWYLGYQRYDNGLLSFERLDRLSAKITSFTRSITHQNQARDQLHELLNGSFSLFLGNDPKEQQQFLQGDRASRAQVTETLEVWCNNNVFSFISEGTQRLPALKLSPKLHTASSAPTHKSLFCLRPTGDPYYPHRLQATLPCWTFRKDVELKSWILRFGGQVKVAQPISLINEIKTYGKEIFRVYHSEDERTLEKDSAEKTEGQ